MKKIVLTLLVTMSMSMAGNLFAQESKCNSCKKQDRSQQKTEMMTKKLGLDDAQKAKVLELNKKFESQLQSAVCEEKNTETMNCSKENKKEAKTCCEKKTENQSNCCKNNQEAQTEKCEMSHHGQRPSKKICPKKMKQLNEEYMKELQTILNAEQLTKLKNGCCRNGQNKPSDNKCNK